MLTESITYKQITKSQFLQITGHILDPYCIRLSNAGPLCKNYAKFYFDPKQLEKELDREGVIFLGPFFHEKCPFFIKCTLCGQIEFLEYALQALIPFSEAVHVISSSAI